MPLSKLWAQPNGEGYVLTYAVVTFIAINGERPTTLWITYEFRGSYSTGGNVVDLSPWLRRVEAVSASPMSGSQFYTAVPVDENFILNPASGRIMLLNSGLVEVANATPVSGVRIRAAALGY